jgi:hypothetical protein
VLIKANRYYIQGGEILVAKDAEIELNEITLFIIEARYILSNKADKLNINQAKESLHCYQLTVSRQTTITDFLKKCCVIFKISNPNIRCYVNRTLLEEKLYSRTIQDLLLMQAIHLNDLICLDQLINGKWELELNDDMKISKPSSKSLVGLNNIGNSIIVISLLHELCTPAAL